MPIYDYDCSACGRRLEVVHGIHDHGPRFCPECGAEGTMRKAFAAPAVHFKGSGWAKKDRAATASPGRARSTDEATKSDDGGAPAPTTEPAPAAAVTAAAPASAQSPSTPAKGKPSGGA
jgi:putative FmdB family regulatory protein